MSPEAGGVFDLVGFAREANASIRLRELFERTGETVTYGRRSEETLAPISSVSNHRRRQPPAHRPPEARGCSRQPEARAPPSADQASSSRSTGRRSAVGCVAVVEHEVV